MQQLVVADVRGVSMKKKAPSIWDKSTKTNKCMCTNGRLENGLVYLQQALSI